MRRSAATHCALVRFVHARCGVRPRKVQSDAVIKRIAATQTAELADAVRWNYPLVIDGAYDVGATSASVLQTMRELSGFREVPVRLRHKTEETTQAGVASAPTFGDARKAALYSNSESWRVYRIVDELLASGEDGPRCYGANIPLEARLPEVAARFLPVMEQIERLAQLVGLTVAVPLTPSLYFGAGQQRTPMHFDPTENLTVCLQGEKFYRLFPPSYAAGLRPKGGLMASLACRWTGVVPAVYSDLDAWSLASGADAEQQLGTSFLDVNLKPGEALYLPSAWWHATGGSQEPNVSIVFGYEPPAAA